MPRATGPAADAATPESAEASNPSVTETTEPLPPWGHWLYTGPPRRIYTNIPATVTPGDVVEWPEQPADDGCWTSVTTPVTKRPDNHPSPAEEV